MQRLNARVIVALVIALGGLFSYLGTRSVNEITGDVQHVSLSPAQEIALGLEAAPSMSQQYGGELDRPEVARYVAGVGERIVARSDAARTPYRYGFHVLADRETVNAFALPGGQVFITAGLLSRLSNEAELAGVLGHEVGHVVARHGAEHLAKQQFSQTLVGAFGVAVYDASHPRSSQEAAAVAAAVAQLADLRYGREDELEADALGVRFMRAAGYDCAGMIELMKVLAGLGGARQPEFFSTHPNPENRLARIQEEIEKAGARGGERGEAAFRDHVLGALPGPGRR